MAVFRNWAGPGILFLLGIGAEMMPIQDWLWSGIIWFLALVWFIYWLYNRNRADSLEVKITPNKWLDGAIINGKPARNPSYHLTPGWGFSAIFGLIIANHNPNNKIHLDIGKILLRKKMLFWNGEVLFEKPLEIQNYPNDYILKDVDIEPQSKMEYSVNTGGNLPIISPFPRKTRLILSLELIGEKHRFEHIIQEFTHNPKQVPDIPDWKKQ